MTHKTIQTFLQFCVTLFWNDLGFTEELQKQQFPYTFHLVKSDCGTTIKTKNLTGYNVINYRMYSAFTCFFIKVIILYQGPNQGPRLHLAAMSS